MLHPIIAKLEENPQILKAHWCLPQAEARLLYILATLSKATHLLEIGTSIGYSTLHLALAAQQNEGHLITIDASLDRQQIALQHLTEAHLSSTVTLICNDALTALESLASQKKQFDFMFVDARKSEYLAYFEAAQRLLKPGGLWIADNTQSHRQKMLPLIEALAAAQAEWLVSDLETPSGLIVAQRRPFP